MSFSSANATAKLEGAPTAASIGMPAIDAFCTNSKLLLPLTDKTESDNGNRLFCIAQPINLSSALCHPTSSRIAKRDSSVSNSAAA